MARAGRKVAITNVRVFSGAGLSDPRTVVIEGDGRIGTDPADAVPVDGKGGVLLPGFIDAHVHLHHAGHLKQLAQHGVTTALDMASWPPDKLRDLRDQQSGRADLRSAGLPATAPGSLHSHLLPLPAEALLSDPEGATRWVEKRIAEGSDYIKLICDIPGPSQATLDAVAQAAHDQGKLVVAHAAALAPFRMAIEAQADAITHVPLDQPLDAESVARMAREKRFAIPTLAMMQAQMQPPSPKLVLRLLLQPTFLAALFRIKRMQSGTKLQYRNAQDSVLAMYRAGIPVLAGTDCHDEPNSPVDVKHGDSLHHELELLVGAGLSPLDALRAATCLPAHHFGLHDRGVIEEGMRADLVLLAENPLDDIRATRSIQRVWSWGVEVDLADL